MKPFGALLPYEEAKDIVDINIKPIERVESVGIDDAIGRILAEDIVAGMDIPDEIIGRIAGVRKSRAADEGMKICLETIQELRGLEGVHGIHIMAIESEDRVAEIVERAGLLPRPLTDT